MIYFNATHLKKKAAIQGQRPERFVEIYVQVHGGGAAPRNICRGAAPPRNNTGLFATTNFSGRCPCLHSSYKPTFVLSMKKSNSTTPTPLADLDREAATLAGTIQEHLNELGL